MEKEISLDNITSNIKSKAKFNNKIQPMKKIKNIRMVSSFQLDKIMKNQAIKVIILFMIQILLHLDYKQNLILKYIHVIWKYSFILIIKETSNFSDLLTNYDEVLFELPKIWLLEIKTKDFI